MIKDRNILSILICLAAIISFGTVTPTVQASVKEPEVIWLKEDYSLSPWVHYKFRFSEDLAAVRNSSNKYGYIDKSGKNHGDRYREKTMGKKPRGQVPWLFCHS